MSDDNWVSDFWRLLKQDRWDECWPLIEAHYGEAEAYYLIGICVPTTSECYYDVGWWVKAANMGHVLATAACINAHIGNNLAWWQTVLNSKNATANRISKRSPGWSHCWTTPDEAWLHCLYLSGDTVTSECAVNAGIPGAIRMRLAYDRDYIPIAQKKPQFWTHVSAREWTVERIYELTTDFPTAAKLVLADSFFDIMTKRITQRVDLTPERVQEIFIYGGAMSKGQTKGYHYPPWVAIYHRMSSKVVATLSLTYMPLCRDLQQLIRDILLSK